DRLKCVFERPGVKPVRLGAAAESFGGLGTAAHLVIARSGATERAVAKINASTRHNIIHSVTNPISRLTGAIHFTEAISFYGGDFFAAERSEWDPETLREQPYDVEKTLRLFEEANQQ